jgi:hypothetical protein
MWGREGGDESDCPVSTLPASCNLGDVSSTGCMVYSLVTQQGSITTYLITGAEWRINGLPWPCACTSKACKMRQQVRGQKGKSLGLDTSQAIPGRVAALPKGRDCCDGYLQLDTRLWSYTFVLCQMVCRVKESGMGGDCLAIPEGNLDRCGPWCVGWVSSEWD